LLFIAIIFLAMPCAHAQQIPECSRRKTGAELMQLAKEHQKNNANISLMKEPPVLPGLPNYTGVSKFVNGYVQPTEKGYVVYQISLLTKEQPEQVRNWYYDAFNMWQWKIMCAGDQVLTAQNKDDNLCTIAVNHAVEQPGYATAVRIYYNQAPPK